MKTGILSVDMRPTWDRYFLNIAVEVAKRGTCVRKQVGCVLVNAEKDIIATGYNGRAAGVVNCLVQPCKGATQSSGKGLEDCEAIHAEQNALMRCSNIHNIETVYTTVSPCVFCINLISGTSARRIVFLSEYSHNEEAKRRWFQREGREWIKYE